MGTVVASVQRVTNTPAGVQVVDAPLRARREAALHARVAVGARGAAPARAAHAAPAHARAVTSTSRVQAILCAIDRID